MEDNPKPSDSENMNQRKIDLTKELEEICESLYWAQEDLKILEYFATDEPDQERMYMKNALGFFGYSRKVCGRNIILELHKLFSPHEEFNIRSFLNDLGSKQKFDGIINPDIVKNWKNRIKKSNDVINRVNNQRSQAIAHKDREFTVDRVKFGHNNGISISEAKELVNIVQDIAKGLYFAIHDIHSDLDKPIGEPVNSLDWIINELVLSQTLKKNKDY